MAMRQQQLQAHVQQQLQAHMHQQQQQHLQQVQQLQFQQAQQHIQQHIQMQMQVQIPHAAEQLLDSPVHSAPGSPADTHGRDAHPLAQQDHIDLQQQAPQQQQAQAQTQDGPLDALSLLVAVASGRNDEVDESAWHGTPPHVASS